MVSHIIHVMSCHVSPARWWREWAELWTWLAAATRWEWCTWYPVVDLLLWRMWMWLGRGDHGAHRQDRCPQDPAPVQPASHRHKGGGPYHHRAGRIQSRQVQRVDSYWIRRWYVMTVCMYVCVCHCCSYDLLCVRMYYVNMRMFVCMYVCMYDLKFMYVCKYVQ